MKTHVLMHPRAEELLVERAIRPLSEAEASELAALGVADDESLDLAAAALAIAETPYEAMPAELFERMTAEPTQVMQAQAQADFRMTLPGVAMPAAVSARMPQAAAAPVAAPVEAPVAALAAARERKASRRGVVVAVVAVAAAAGIAFVLGSGLWRGGPPAQPPSIARAELLQSAPDAHALAWTATADAAAHGASGDVVWSTQQQRGYMRFVGLAANDPTAWQYQLWIFDKTRDQAFPVDGGVFDVSATGEVIVAISPKLHVDDATLFAVTVERPGGVVVSKRERIVVTAKPS